MNIKPTHIIIILLIFIIAFFGITIYYNEEYTIKGEFLYHGIIRADITYEYPDALISDEDKIKWFHMINWAGTPQDKKHIDKLLNKL